VAAALKYPLAIDRAMHPQLPVLQVHLQVPFGLDNFSVGRVLERPDWQCREIGEWRLLASGNPLTQDAS
jgi:hypothetical protein